MRKLISAVAALGLLTVVGVLTVGGQASAESDRVEVLNLTSVTDQEAELDLGDEGFGVGDQFVFSDKLFHEGRQVGVDGGACTITNVDGQTATANCLDSLRLPKGQITVQGLVTFAEDDMALAVAITGGTGAYNTAHGELRLTPVSENVDQLRLRIIH